MHINNPYSPTDNQPTPQENFGQYAQQMTMQGLMPLEDNNSMRFKQIPTLQNTTPT